MSIHVEHVTKRYGDATVLRDVSLEVAEGEFCVLLGPSGSGKSTILRILAGLTDADAGRVVIHGRDVTHDPPQKRGVGFVFQHYALFRHMTVAENVEFALRIRRVPASARRRRREDLLELVGLAGLGGRRPEQLSGGQRQRVALARALAHAPEVLLLDEPFGALDAKIRSDLRRTVRAIQRELSITTVFVTHDQEEAFEIADRIAVLDHGRLLEHGSPRELYLHPTTEFSATFLGNANLVIGERTAGGVRVGDLEVQLGGSRPHEGEPSRVQLLFRPEDVAVKDTREALGWPELGRAVVESSAFLGPFERLRLRLPGVKGVRAISPAAPFGADYVVVEAIRTQHQARRFPLRAGDTAWVGLRRAHALAHPGMAFLLVHDAGNASEAALALGARLGLRAHARLTLLACGAGPEGGDAALEACRGALGASAGAIEERVSPAGLAEALRTEAQRRPYDLVVAGVREATAPETATVVLGGGTHHALLVPREPPELRKVLVCAALGEPGKRGVGFAGRLARHLDAEVTILTVVRGTGADPAVEEHARRYLAASARTLAPLGVQAATRLRSGVPEQEIRAEIEEGGYELVAVGAPSAPGGGPPRMEGPVAAILRSARVPVLVVRTSEEEP